MVACRHDDSWGMVRGSRLCYPDAIVTLHRAGSALLLALILVSLPADSFAAKRKRRAAPAKPQPTAKPMAVPFIHDDYSRALADARARKVPLFIESWAPW